MKVARIVNEKIGQGKQRSKQREANTKRCQEIIKDMTGKGSNGIKKCQERQKEPSADRETEKPIYSRGVGGKAGVKGKDVGGGKGKKGVSVKRKSGH